MSASDWKIGQAVVAYLPYHNTDRVRRTLITGIGRKFITVGGLTHRFDMTKNPPASNHGSGTDGYLYTPEQYDELQYSEQVIRRVTSQANQLPLSFLLMIGDFFGIQRPEHLRDDIDPALLKAAKELK